MSSDASILCPSLVRLLRDPSPAVRPSRCFSAACAPAKTNANCRMKSSAREERLVSGVTHGRRIFCHPPVRRLSPPDKSAREKRRVSAPTRRHRNISTCPVLPPADGVFDISAPDCRRLGNPIFRDRRIKKGDTRAPDKRDKFTLGIKGPGRGWMRSIGNGSNGAARDASRESTASPSKRRRS